MADISAEIAAFKGAVYGEEVRDSLVALANKLNNEVTNNTSTIDKAFYYIRQLTSSDDLNTLGEFGVYTFIASDLPQHVPNGYNGSARLLNIKYYTDSGTSSTTSVHSQIFIGSDRCLYYRIKIAENSIFSEWQVLNGPGSVTSAHISDGAIKTAKLADQSVTADKIANYTITTNKIATQSIDVGRLASNSVSTYKIQDGAVTANKLAANSVSMDKLDNALNKLLTTIVTPEQYGAVGDGVTDDTAALLLAIQTNRTVVFGMKKTYLVSGLTIQNTYNVIIQGNNSTLLLPYENSNNKTILGFVHCTYINVYDLKIATNFGTDNQALDISELFSVAPYGISMNENSSCMRIINCEVSMVKDGICANDSNRILISQCRVRNVGQEPIAVRQCDGVIIEKNDLYWHTGDGILIKAYSFDRFYDITIRDNRLYYPKQTIPSSLGALIMGGGITINAENTSISYLTKGIIITNNHVIGCRYGILLANVAFATISNNVVRVNKRNNQGTYDNGSAAYGLTLDPQWAPDNAKTTVKVIFSNNVGSGGRAIFRSYHTDEDVPCDQIVFANNVAEGTDLHNSQLGFDVRNATVINNLITNCKKNGNFRNCVVIGNQFLTPYYIPTSIDESDCCFLDNTCIVENNIIEGTQVYVNCDSFASLRGNIFRLTKSNGLIINCETVSSYVTVMGNDYNNHPLEDDNITTMNNPQNITSDYSVDIDRAISDAEAAASTAQTAASMVQATVLTAQASIASAIEAAQTATEAATEATETANNAIESIGDISELAVPEMTSEIRGGAKLGNGLKVDGGKLSIDTDINSANGIVHGSITSLTAKGLATQKQTTGKNLARPNPEITNGSFSNVICTYLGNGMWRMVGTNDADSANTRSFKMFDLGVLPAGAYCVTFEMVSGTSDSNIISRIGTGSSAAYYSNYTNVVATPAKNVRTFTADGSNQYWVCMQLSAHATVDGVFRLQVELGSTPTDYEPYTGGAPSPSPDYPQEIQVARGRNLVSEFENGGINWSTGNNAGSTTTRIRTKDYIDVKEGATYTLSIQSGYKVAIRFYDSNGTDKGSEGSDTYKSTLPYTFTIPSGVAKLRFLVAYSTDADITADEMGWIQLELGSTPTPYVPYGYVGVNVGSPFKLYKAEHAIDAGGTEGANIDYDIYSISGVRAGTYEISYVSSNTTRRTRIHGYDSSGNWVLQLLDASSTENKPAGKKVRVVTVPEGVVEIRVNLGDDFSDLVSTRAIPVPLPSKGYAASLPDGTADVLTIDGAGKVEWESSTNMVTFDGSESWINTGTSTRRYTEVSGGRVGAATMTNSLCDRYTISSSSVSAIPDGHYRYGATSSPNLYVSDSAHEDMQSWTTWLAQNPVAVLYPLATPTTEQCGYIDWPDIPEDSIISCPELDELGIHYIIGNDVKKMAMEWYKRAKYELENRVSDLEQAVSDLVTS